MAQECEAHQSPHIEATKLSSVAGPMSPLQAKAFYNEWRSPYQSLDLKMGVNVRRTDPDRGLERIGRYVTLLRSLCSCIKTKHVSFGGVAFGSG